ncbi:retrovirus-related pol polyprotein from transposon TNT 1-94 [Tanacetum coccineum]
MTSRPRTRVFRPGPVWGCDKLVSRAKVIENQEKNANNKRKFENQPKDNHVPRQPPCKKPSVTTAYTIEANGKKAYAGNLPYSNKYIKYPIELVNRKLIGSDIMLRGCTLGLLGHPFNIDLIPVELGSFDVMIGMDWLANHHTVIACDEKIVQIPYGDEVLIIQAYNDMQQKIEQLQAQLEDLKGKSKDTPCVSNTLDHLSQKLENENVELEFQIIPKVVETNDLSKLVTLNSVPTTTESKVVTNDKVIAPGMFRINPFKTSREDKFVPINKVRASVRTNSIIVSQPHVITKKDVNSNSNGLSSTGVDITTKTRRPQPRSNTKNDRVPSASKSSCIKNKEVEVEEHHRNLLLSKNKKHMSSECNNVKLAIRNDKSEVICAMCKQCLITSNHDVCVLNYVNGMNSRNANQSENVSNVANQKKHKPKVRKYKKLGSKERLASPTPSKPRSCLRWSPTGRIFDLKGKIIASSESECQSDCSNGDNACTSNPQEPTIKRFPNSTSFLGRLSKFVYGTFRFENDHVAAIMGYGDLQYQNILITRVYFVEGLGHNLFSVGQFCDSDLEAAFRRNTCFVRNLEGVDLYHKEHLCPSCEQGKSKKASHLPKPVPNSKQRLHLLHMDLCGPMRVESINGKRYVLVIVYDYSRYTWVHFLRSKDEAPEVIKTFLKKITMLLQAPVIIVRTDNGIKFKNQVLQEYFNSVGISHQASSVNGVIE